MQFYIGTGDQVEKSLAASIDGGETIFGKFYQELIGYDDWSDFLQCCETGLTFGVTPETLQRHYGINLEAITEERAKEIFDQARELVNALNAFCR